MNIKTLTVLCAIGVLSACHPPSVTTGASKSLPSLETVTLSLKSTPQEIQFDGVIEALNQATVSAQTTGRITEIPVDVGDYVGKGDLIIRLTDTEQTARVASANAQFIEAQAQFTRIQEMLSKKLIAQADVDKSEAAFKSAQAHLSEAQQNLTYTKIYAPYAGLVVNRYVQIGETVAPGKALMTGLSLEHLRVQVDIPQQSIGLVRQYKKARIYLTNDQILATDDVRFPPSADPQTHSFKVWVNLPQGKYSLFPGTFIKIAFITGEQQQLLISASAISKRGEMTGVYVLNNDSIEFRYLHLGSITLDHQYPILAGAEAGEIIAVDPVSAALAYQNKHRVEH